MRHKRFLLLLLLFTLVPFMISCDLSLSFFDTTTDAASTTYIPDEVNGTITFNNSDYYSFPYYESSTYELTDVDAYNDILLETQDFVRHANIEIESTFYEEYTVLPWSNETQRKDIAYSTGSGFIFMEDEDYYYAITNYHVIDPDEYLAEYSIKAFGDEDYSSCTIVVYDEDIDLAVVKFSKAERTDLTILDIYSRLYYKFTPGELVLACGNPQETYDVVTFGEFVSLESITNVDYDVIYHTALIDEGSSGGALVDVDGNFLGVNTWGVDSDESDSFSIPNYIVYMFLINNGILVD
ncbi:MAG: serine protease [Sphaerochaetaceae bacterium]|nr:serine protease [Sphaerochaetaceae bacterium]